ncbi:hypothetical protein M5689_000928 [Euphorbia peplus]|nr:hypothetical protein M5689_000928 [Euphorbia peplus]
MEINQSEIKEGRRRSKSNAGDRKGTPEIGGRRRSEEKLSREKDKALEAAEIKRWWCKVEIEIERCSETFRAARRTTTAMLCIGMRAMNTKAAAAAVASTGTSVTLHSVPSFVVLSLLRLLFSCLALEIPVIFSNMIASLLLY